jgi:hypothetical protein
MMRLIALAALLGAGSVAAACASPPPATPPDYSGPRPELVETGWISHRAEIVIDTPLSFYDAWRQEVPLSDVLPGAPGIPAVAGTEPLSGDWDQVGARRRVLLADGHQAVEQVLANEGPALFRYQVWGFTSPAGRFADYAVGEFRLAEAGPGRTRVTWTYAFDPSSPLARVPLWLFVQTQFRPFMEAGLRRMKAGAEAAWAAQARPKPPA